ncbi:MAG: glycerol-3-phosphate dehydrogenase, partial [Idiomarinaceae bacterium]|nr:glycerol-3-phosphate dehydrogenase [Idiomarinaceae bacterium]
MKTANVAILGAGSYGTALAICFARKGIATTLWGRDKTQVAAMREAHENAHYLPDCPFPETLQVTDDLAAAVKDVKNVLVVVPSHAFADLLRAVKPSLSADARVAWATKGLEPETGRLLYEVAEEELGNQHPLAVLSGPTFAIEMAKGLPTAISMSSTDQAFVDELSEMLHCERSFRVYTNDDFIGIQLGGA